MIVMIVMGERAKCWHKSKAKGGRMLDGQGQANVLASQLGLFATFGAEFVELERLGEK
jgi:hypothetical protein